MPVRRRPAKAARATKAAPPARRGAAAKSLSEYGTPASVTDYHKLFARWIVDEVGYDPNTAKSKRTAFLMGVSIATAARARFMDSDTLAEWREETGQVKPGPKPASERTAPKRGKARRAPEPEEEYDEEDSEEYEDDDEFDEEDSDEFDEEDEEDSDEDDEEFDEEDEEDEEPPTPVRKPRKAAKAAPARSVPKSARSRAASTTRTAKATPAKAKPAKGKPAASDEDDELLF